LAACVHSCVNAMSFGLRNHTPRCHKSLSFLTLPFLSRRVTTPPHRLIFLCPRMLSHFLHRDPQQVSRLVDQMEEDGLITRVRDPAKRNRVKITLPEKGRKHTSG
jgi:DNA-binding MarR family transcriptional regulator